MQKTITIPDYTGKIQYRKEDNSFTKIGTVRLYTQNPSGNQPDLKGYISVEGKYYEISLWKTQEASQ